MDELRLESALPLGRYLVRPRRLPGEGLSAWLCRHFLSNALPMPWRLRTQVILSYRHRLDPAPRLHQLKKLNALLAPEDQISPEPWLAWCFELESAGKAEWQSSHRNYYPQAFCPSCLREWGCFLELWEIPSVEACPRHGVSLSARCPECDGSPADWRLEDGHYVCQCERPLTEFKALPTAELALEWARIVTLQPGIGLPPGFFFECPREPPALSLPMLHVLKKVIEQTGWGRRQSSQAERRVLFGWPKYHRTLLKRLALQVFTGAAATIGILPAKANIAAALYSVLAATRKIQSPEAVDLVHAELNRYCLFVFGGSVLFVNPRIYPDGAETVRGKFAAWWKTVDWGGDDSGKIGSLRSYQGLSRFHRPLVIHIVRTLLRLADDNISSRRLAGLWSRWRPSPAVRGGANTAGLIDLILDELYRTPLSGLRLLGLCLDGAIENNRRADD